MIYLAADAGKSLHHADDCEFSLMCDFKPGKAMHTDQRYPVSLTVEVKILFSCFI
jgi:hypothetical protein